MNSPFNDLSEVGIPGVKMLQPETETNTPFSTESSLAIEADDQYTYDSETDPDTEDYGFDEEDNISAYNENYFDETEDEASVYEEQAGQNEYDYEEESTEISDDSELVEDQFINLPDFGKIANSAAKMLFDKWLESVKTTKTWFPDEPFTNIDQLPSNWIIASSFYTDFINKYGADAKTIIGDSSQKVIARYFVIHDTAGKTDYTPEMIAGKGVHLWLNVTKPVLLGNDWHQKGIAVKIERYKANKNFVHIEIVRDPHSMATVDIKTGGNSPTYADIMKEGGIKSYGTYYTDRQYELLAYAFIVASIRKGTFLTVTVHREVDRSVTRIQKGKYAHGHGDPQFFDINYFYSIVCRLLKIPANMTFGIQNERVLAFKQGNMAGNVNEFIPYVTGDAAAANQYGKFKRLDPKTSKYKVVKLFYGYYYDVTALSVKLIVKEVDDEIFAREEHYVPSGTTRIVSEVMAPPLLGDDLSVPGYTCYAKIDLGNGNYPLDMTGIYLPAAFNSKEPVDLILYLHGMTGTFPGKNEKINQYWSKPDPKYDLRIREEINAAGKNVVLVAPSLGDSPNKYKNYLSGKKGGLDNYLQQVRAAINIYIIQSRFKADPIDFRNIILAAHSAGGYQMMLIATKSENPVYGNRITECWGFDSLYEGKGGVVNSWLRWATKNAGKNLMIYYKYSTQGNAFILTKNAKRLSNVFVKRSNAKNHYLVPKEHLKERIIKLGSTKLTKTDFEEAQFEEENYHHEEENFWNEEADFAIPETEDYVTNLANAVRLNNFYADNLGWRSRYDDINTLLLPYSGLVGVSLNEEEFAYALAAWQQAQGFSNRDSDGILGPTTWRVMQPLLASTTTTTTTTALPVAQVEWNASRIIQSQYATWQLYEAKRNDVVSWGITVPAPYFEAAINEWNANRGIHNHFEDAFDGILRNRRMSYVGAYLNVKRHYNALGIADPAAYFTANIRSVTFFNRTTPTHTALITVLNTAQRSLITAGHNFRFNDAWSFNPRTIRRNIHQLSDHALGKAIDLNRLDNPLIINAGEILVINAVCGTTLPIGFSAETDPVVFRNASDHFRATFNPTWIAAQTNTTLLAVIADPDRRIALNGYAARGFMNLQPTLVRALQAAGASWGGSWRSPKDFMHFEVP